jgi:stage II sporulation protein D
MKNDQGQVVHSGTGLAATTVVLNGGLVEIGGKTLAIGRYLEFIPEVSAAVRVNQHAYRGTIWLYPSGLDRLIVINHVLAEDYLKGVLRGELPRQFAMEAYKAQAVAARTYALYEVFSKRGRQIYDVHCTVASQVYSGADAETDKAVQAVEKTAGIVVTGPTKRGYRIFPTYFSSTCGGKTQGGRYLAAVDPEFEPLKGGIECPYCRISHRRTWPEKRIPLTTVRNKINDKMNERIGEIRQIRATSVVNDRITMVAVTDVHGRTLQIPGEKFRLIVGPGPSEMASTMCKMRVEGTMLVLSEGKGLGHGVGMCQWGAEGMARQGMTAIQILKHYYPNCKLVRVY